MRLLLSAFEPYDQWDRNSSWEALVAWLSKHGGRSDVVTRKYPVHLSEMKSRLERDLAQGVDGVLHLGQAPGISRVHLEAIAINVAGIAETPGGDFGPILDGAPLAYRTEFPVGLWSRELRLKTIPAAVSYHAGTYLCNALMYLSHHWFASRGEVPLVGFVHLPLLPEQVLDSGQPYPSLPVSQTAQAIDFLVHQSLAFIQDRSKSLTPFHESTSIA